MTNLGFKQTIPISVYGDPISNVIKVTKHFLETLNNRDFFEYIKLKHNNKEKISLYMFTDSYNQNYYLALDEEGDVIALRAKTSELLVNTEYNISRFHLSIEEIGILERYLVIWDLESPTINKHKKSLDSGKIILINKNSKFIK